MIVYVTVMIAYKKINLTYFLAERKSRQALGKESPTNEKIGDGGEIETSNKLPPIA